MDSTEKTQIKRQIDCTQRTSKATGAPHSYDQAVVRDIAAIIAAAEEPDSDEYPQETAVRIIDLVANALSRQRLYR